MFDKLFSSMAWLVGSGAEREIDLVVEADRRDWARFPCDVKVRCHLMGSSDRESLSAEVMNISRGGISLLVDRELGSGQFLGVDLPTSSEGGVSCVLAYVLHANLLDGGKWALGCSFSAELDDEELQAFGASRLRPEKKDQRAWVRFPCPFQATFQVVRGTETVSQSAQVVDIAPTGIGLQIQGPMEVGTLISIEMGGREPAPTLTMLASVVRSREQPGNEWMLGCTFIRELTAEELRALIQTN